MYLYSSKEFPSVKGHLSKMLCKLLMIPYMKASEKHLPHASALLEELSGITKIPAGS